MTQDKWILGIDIAKDDFKSALIVKPGKMVGRTFKNTAEGFAQLTKWLGKRGVVHTHACMEATGTYGDALAKYLYTAGHLVSVVNPSVILAYGKTKLTRNKTDELDAELIAQYCHAENPRLWEPDPPEVAELQALSRRLDDLNGMRVQEINRLKSGIESCTVTASVEEAIAYFEQEIARIEALIREHIQRHPGLKLQDELAQSVPGVGKGSSALFLGVNLTKFESADAAVAFFGLNPKLKKSGKYEGQTRISKMGDPSLRARLYWPAIAAMTHNPIIRALCARLDKRGRCGMVCIVAAMRKLVRQVYGVLKSGRLFDLHAAPRVTKAS